MQLLKERSFGDLFSDPFHFFRDNAKHILVNYFKLLGLFILVVLACMIPLAYHYYDFMMELINSTSTGTTPDINNIGSLYANLFLHPSVLLMFVAFLVYSLMSYNFFPIYMNLYVQKGKQGFEFNDIINSFKENSGSIIKLFLILLLLFIPFYIAFAITAFISLFTIVGIFLLFGFIISYFQLIWFTAVHNKEGNFDVLGKTFTLFKDNFFSITGVTILMYFCVMLIYYTFNFIFMLLIQIFLGFDMYDMNPGSVDQLEQFSDSFTTIIPVFIGMYGVLFLLMTFIGILMQIQQGIIFYTRINDLEGHTEHSEIDSIGLEE